MAERFDNLEEHLEKFIENIRQLGIIVSDFQPSSQAGLNQKLWVVFYWERYSGTYQANEHCVNAFCRFLLLEISWYLDYKTSRSAVSSFMRSTYRWRSLSESTNVSCYIVVPVRLYNLYNSLLFTHLLLFFISVLLWIHVFVVWERITGFEFKSRQTSFKKSDVYIGSCLDRKSGNVTCLVLLLFCRNESHFKIRHTHIIKATFSTFNNWFTFLHSGCI